MWGKTHCYQTTLNFAMNCVVLLGFLWFLALCRTSNGNDPPGHKKPLGSHTQPRSIQNLDEFPTPWDFYKTYVKPGKPVVFKSVLNGSHPIFNRWTDEYLEKMYGEKIIDIEMGKKETRSGNMDFRPLKYFLKIYKELDVYMVQSAFPEMADEIMVPRCLHCGGFQKYIDKVMIWFSSGGTKSVLHYDFFENINCLLGGTKELVMMDKQYRDFITANGYKPEGGFISVDIDSVDMNKFPKLQEVPWYRVTMEPGDCLFIPSEWWHQVNSFGKRNIAVNLWFSPLFWFNATDCETTGDLKPVEPLSKFGLTSPLENNRVNFILMLNEIPISKKNYMKCLGQEGSEALSKLFDFIDRDQNGLLASEELYAFRMEELIERFSDSLPELISELRQGEESIAEQADMMQEMTTEETETGTDTVDDFLNAPSDKSRTEERLQDHHSHDEF